MTEIPVLLITFNRPSYVKEMIKALKEAEVCNLYIFKDGPRPNNINDYKASKEIEEIIASIDWKCTVTTNYMQNNLGCGYGPYSAISWAFQYVDELVILEDDCVPTKAFFKFCKEMLQRYRNDNRVSVISGRSQLYMPEAFATQDYIFTQFAPTWGWATWKRVWMDFDIKLRNVKDIIKTEGFNAVFASKKHKQFFTRRFNSDIKDPLLHTHVWDNQFGYHSRISGALRISPAKNLIKYIGMTGTHSNSSTVDFVNMQIDDSFTVKKHPSKVSLIKEYDEEYFRKYVQTPLSLPEKIIAKFKRVISK